MKVRLIADIRAARTERIKNQKWASDERIADYLLSKGWALPTRCGACSYKFTNRVHDKAGCPLCKEGWMGDD